MKIVIDLVEEWGWKIKYLRIWGYLQKGRINHARYKRKQSIKDKDDQYFDSRLEKGSSAVVKDRNTDN